MIFDMSFTGKVITLKLSVDFPLAAPVLCFSAMAPIAVQSGGDLLRSDGGYAEVQLPDLTPGLTHEIKLCYADPAFRPANRAWLPMGSYLRHADGILQLPTGSVGVHKVPPPETEPFAGLWMVPQPSVWRADGNVLRVHSFAVSDDAFDAVDTLAARRGMASFLTDTGVPVIIDDDISLAGDEYHLIIAPDGIRVTANSYGGRFYAAITLLTLRITHAGGIPCGTIIDAPRFGWRGQHLDCARHFYAPTTICHLLDLMALCKLNRFHWHFSDDEAFRIEIERLPSLWKKTRMRGEGELVPGVFGGGVRAGGSYSKADVAEIVAHAKALNIDILPEIEVPAHALALTRAFPDTRDPDDVGTEQSVQGYTKNVMNPAMAATWEILEDVATEIADMFPFGMLHLGCDELPEGTWMGSPRARTLMAQEGLQTTQDLQGWTMAKLASKLTTKGFQLAAWEEAAQGENGGIGHDALLFSWSGQGPGVAAARLGYDVIMTPAQNVYLDMAHTDDPDDWGANWAAYIALTDTIKWDPVPADAPDIADKVKGVQGCFWSEFTTEDHQVMPMIAPRILGVAVKAWQADETINADALTALAGHYDTIFDALGWAQNGRR